MIYNCLTVYLAHYYYIILPLYLQFTGEDCATCGPKVTSSSDVAGVEVPEWKKKALAKGLAADAAPFGMTDWNMEASTSATDAATATDDHEHSHEHSHSHGHS